jgi:hypothetical protein
MQKAVKSEDDRKDVVLKRWDEMCGELCNLDTRRQSRDTVGETENGGCAE